MKEIYSITEVEFDFSEEKEEESPAVKKKILVLVDIDNTIVYLRKDFNSSLIEPEIVNLIQQLNAHPRYETIGFTSRYAYWAMYKNDGYWLSVSAKNVAHYRSLGYSVERFDSLTKKQLESHGINFSCHLPINFVQSDCRITTNPDSYYNPKPFYDHNIIFSDKAHKAGILYGFLPSIIHEIDTIIFIDDIDQELTTVPEVIETLNKKYNTKVELKAYWYRRVEMEYKAEKNRP